MDVAILGPMTVSDGRGSVPLGGPKQRAVLAMLVGNAGQIVPADTLVQAVYGQDAPTRRKRTISTYISALRAELGDAIVKDGSGWRFAADPSTIDAVCFEQLVKAAAQRAPDAAAEALRQALAMWKGHPYTEVEVHGHLDAEITRLGELRLAALEARIEANLAAGRHVDVTGEVAGLIAEHPYRERFRAQHMVALYRGGRQREALASYQELRMLLVEELGADPTPELRQLEQRIITHHADLDFVVPRSVQRRAVLVADLGHPLDQTDASMADRNLRLERMTTVVERAAELHGGGEAHPAGTASYLVFDSAVDALAAAQTATTELGDSHVRIAVDWGDIEADESGIAGPPISRSAALVSAAHPGQVLISSEAHDEVIHSDGSVGLRFESLGAHQLPGIEAPAQVLQLLIGDPPRSFAGLDPSRLPPPLPSVRRSVPGYELREPLGDGSVGSLYRAYQPSVGREVIVEVIDRSITSDPDFIRNFEADAQRLALLDHPHINPLLDYWRGPDGAFLVYRNRRGGLLAGGAEATPALLEQVASAMACAHSYGIFHGSVRPDRILLDESGYGYLMGFPIGKLGVRPSPDYAAYIAPEMLGGGEPSVAADVYALGVLGHEIGAGSSDADRPLVPTEGPLARALLDDPAQRQTSVAELMAALTPGITDDAASRFSERRNPYKGLAAFHESDTGDFFGRSDVTASLVETLNHSHFLAVVGPSGVGKSSVVRAGLIPAVRHGALAGSESWVITDMLPGAHPFLELRRALERVVVDLPPTLVEGLVGRNADALDTIDAGLPPGTELLLVIDQFEELFTLCDEPVAQQFIDLLVAVVEARAAHVVITMRADFLDRPLAYAAFGELIGDGLVTVAAPSLDELGEIIAGPARSVGVAVDAGLIERIRSEVHDRPGALPLLQHALAELFDARTADALTLDDYERIGGVAGSLERRAEATLHRLDDQLQTQTKRTMLRMVTVVGDGAPTRRRVRLDQLGVGERTIVEAFVGARLLVNDNEPETRTPTVEVSHEALLTQWPRLNGWVASHRGELTQHARLSEAADEWAATGRTPGHLLTGGRLAQHESWVHTSDLALSDSQRELLADSRAEADAQSVRERRRRSLIMSGFGAAAVVAAVLAVFALAASRDADDRRTQAEVAEAAAIAEADRADESTAEAAANAAEAEAARGEAQSNADDADAARVDAQANADQAVVNAALAKARELSAQAVNVLDDDPELAIRLALESADATPDGQEQPPEVVDTLWRALQEDRLEQVVETGFDEATYVALSPDDSVLYVVIGFPSLAQQRERLAVQAYSTSDFQMLWQYDGPTPDADGFDGMFWLHPSPDGSRVSVTISTRSDRQVVVLDATDGREIDVLSYARPCLAEGWGWSPDGTRFLVTVPCLNDNDLFDKTVEVRDGQTLELLTTIERPVPTMFDETVVFDENGVLYVFEFDGPLTRYEPPSYEQATVFEATRGYGDVAPDGSVAVIYDEPAECRRDVTLGAADCGTLASFDASTGTRIDRLNPLPAPATLDGVSTLFSNHERLVALATEGAETVIWDIPSGEQAFSLPTGPTINGAISADGRRLYTSHRSGVFQVWDLGPGVGLARIADLGADVSVSSNTTVVGDTIGAFVVNEGAARRSSVVFFDLETGEPTGAPVPGQQPIRALAGDRFFITEATGQGGPFRWFAYDPRGGNRTELGGCAVDGQTGLCPDGAPPAQYFWAASRDGTELLRQGDGAFTLVDPFDGSVVGALTPTAPFQFIAEFSDEWIGGSANFTAVIEDRTTGEELAFNDRASFQYEMTGDLSVWFVLNTALVLDFVKYEFWDFPIDVGQVDGMALHPPTRRVALGDENAIHIFDVDDGRLLQSVPVPNVADMHWLDPERLLVATEDGAWATVDLRVDWLIAAAEAAQTGSFTADECNLYRIDPCPID